MGNGERRSRGTEEGGATPQMHDTHRVKVPSGIVIFEQLSSRINTLPNRKKSIRSIRKYGRHIDKHEEQARYSKQEIAESLKLVVENVRYLKEQLDRLPVRNAADQQFIERNVLDGDFELFSVIEM